MLNRFRTAPLSALLLSLVALHGIPGASAKGAWTAPLTPDAVEEEGPVLHPSLAPNAYYHGKTGFAKVSSAKDHAYKEFKKKMGLGQINPANQEYFSYIYTARNPDTNKINYFHTPWATAGFLKTENGSEQYCVQPPFPEGPNLKRNTLIHSHPTNNPNGAGPSRMDVALASTYRKANGGFRYLYLINSQLRLVQFKAVRVVDPGNPLALLRLPHKPILGRDWLK